MLAALVTIGWVTMTIERKYYGEHTKGCCCADCLPEIRVAEGYAIPGPEVSCMDAAEMLIDGFIIDVGIFTDRESRNEIVRRVGLLLSMQRESLKREYSKLKSAVDTIPAAIMLAGGPPYKLTFTEACLREIMESQK